MWRDLAYNYLISYAQTNGTVADYPFRGRTMTQIEIIYLIGGGAGLLLVASITLLVIRSRLKAELTTMARLGEMEKTALEETSASERLQLEAVRADLANAKAQLDQRRDAMADLEAQKAALGQSVTRIPVLEQSLERSRHVQEQLNAVNLSLEKKLSELSTRLDAERRQAEEKMALLNDARERLTVEFKVLAERILEEKGKTFADRNKAQMDGLISPLREQLGDFKKRVEDVYDKESRDRAALLNEIGHLKHLNERIGKDALNLTNALTGDVKTLGGWGEVILEAGIRNPSQSDRKRRQPLSAGRCRPLARGQGCHCGCQGVAQGL